MNFTRCWGEVYLLREVRLKKRTIITTVRGAQLPMDGHVACLHDSTLEACNASVGHMQGYARLWAVAIRCWGWQRRFAGDRSVDMTTVMTAADMNAAASARDVRWSPFVDSTTYPW